MKKRLLNILLKTNIVVILIFIVYAIFCVLYYNFRIENVIFSSRIYCEYAFEEFLCLTIWGIITLFSIPFLKVKKVNPDK